MSHFGMLQALLSALHKGESPCFTKMANEELKPFRGLLWRLCRTGIPATVDKTRPIKEAHQIKPEGLMEKASWA